MPKPKFKCVPGCCECCGAHLLFEKELIQAHRDKFQVEPILEVEYRFRGIQISTSDGYCIFLNRHERRCTIYEDRPMTCVYYGPVQPCPYINPDGTPRSKGEIARHKAAIREVSRYILEHPIQVPRRKGESR